MKIRLAKKILSSRFYYDKHKKLRPPYVNEKGQRVYPSFAELPDVRRAIVRYCKWLGVYKKNDL